ncbi:hypothetical protein [Micromonospora sp. SH-82]|uniref:hypothetical protein n=1 Tax=Micromonospora sp. SH-82 TaxID=3132938 RepID=UPI003EBBBEF2
MTVDLEAFNTPDRHGDQPPSVTLAVNNPEQRTADYSKLEGLDPATVRGLAASLLSGCWEGAAVGLIPQKAAELGASPDRRGPGHLRKRDRRNLTSTRR